MSLKDYGKLLLDGEIKVKHDRSTSQRYTFCIFCSRFDTSD